MVVVVVVVMMHSTEADKMRLTAVISTPPLFVFQLSCARKIILKCKVMTEFRLQGLLEFSGESGGKLQ